MTPAADDLVLAVNSGSSSLKFGLFAEQNGEETVVLRGGADGIGKPDGRLRVEDSAGTGAARRRLLAGHAGEGA